MKILLLAMVLGLAVRAVASISVKDYGAVGDGKADCTGSFQKALDAAAEARGETVQVPPGNYRFLGPIRVPSAVTLQGSWNSVPAHNGLRDAGLPKPTDDGTTLLVEFGEGTEEGAFITLNTNSTLKGVVVYYPNQKRDEEPKPYPYAVAMRGKNPAVVDVELLNPYNGIDATQNERHLIRNVQGQPLRRGVLVDQIYDIGRIENVHFNPWWSMEPKLFAWQQANGEAFVFGRTDWQYVLNTFCFGYRAGYRFIRTKDGVCNGNFLGIGADDCFTALEVEDCAPYGLLVTNGEFVSFHGPDPTMVVVGPKNSGKLQLTNCSFWGPCNQIARIEGQGTVAFSDCTFCRWDGQDQGLAALLVRGGTVAVRGCEFQLDKNVLDVRLGAKRVRVSDCLFQGEPKVRNEDPAVVQVRP